MTFLEVPSNIETLLQVFGAVFSLFRYLVFDYTLTDIFPIHADIASISAGRNLC